MTAPASTGDLDISISVGGEPDLLVDEDGDVLLVLAVLGCPMVTLHFDVPGFRRLAERLSAFASALPDKPPPRGRKK